MVCVLGTVLATNVFAAVSVAACAWIFGCCVCIAGLANTQLIFCCFLAGDASPSFTDCSFRFAPMVVVVNGGVAFVAAGFSFKNSSTCANVVVLQKIDSMKLKWKLQKVEWKKFGSLDWRLLCGRLLYLMNVWLLNRYGSRRFNFVVYLICLQRLAVQRDCVLLNGLLLRLHLLDVGLLNYLRLIRFVDVL